MANMPYTQNPYLPKVRAQAVNLVNQQSWSIRKTARYFGVQPSTVMRWVRRSPTKFRISYLETRSSRPHSSPRSTPREIEDLIVKIRLTRPRCSEIIQAQLLNDNIKISLSTVKRILKRRRLIKPRSPWKKYHLSGPRPLALKPGVLVQTDTVHIPIKEKRRMYLFTVIDCFSRWAYAKASKRLNSRLALEFIREAQKKAPFNFACVQSDHGPEFTSNFTSFVQATGIRHRHSRVRQPNDNAHIERFNRTIQDEMRPQINQFKKDVPRLNREISKYINYYNNERLHLGLGCKTPAQVLRSS